MGGSLTQRRRVWDEGLRIVNHCQQGRERTVPAEEASAYYVPAAAVIRRMRALSGFRLVGGNMRPEANFMAQPWSFSGYGVS